MSKDRHCIIFLAAFFVAFSISCGGGRGSTTPPVPAVCDPGKAAQVLSATIQNTGTEDLQNYALAISFDKNSFNFTIASSDGHDLAVWDAVTKLALSFWLEAYDQQVGKAILWVKVPALKAGASQVIWITAGIIQHCSTQSSNGYAVFPFFSDVQDANHWSTENHLTVTNTITTSPISVENRQVIVSDGTYNSTPGVAQAANGDWVLTYRKGMGHVNVPFVILRRSQDQGKTWGPETAYWNTSGPDPALVQTSGGDLLISFVKLDPSSIAGAAYSRSVDNGLTWAPFTFLDQPVDHTSAFSPTLFTNGSTMYGVGYGPASFDANSSPFFWQSTDDGITWTRLSELRNVGDPGVNETAVAQSGANQIFAVMRADDSQQTYGRYSFDQGFTWGPILPYTTQLGIIQGPQFIQAGNALLLLARESMPSSSVSNSLGLTRQFVAFVSFDGGQTFDHGTLLESYTGLTIDGGYSWPLLLPDGSVYVAYYADPHNLRQPDMKSLVVRFESPVTTPSNALHILSRVEAGRASKNINLVATKYSVEFRFRSKEIAAGSQFSVMATGQDLTGGAVTVMNWELPSVHADDPTSISGLFANNQFVSVSDSFNYGHSYRIRTFVDEAEQQQEGQLLDSFGTVLNTSGVLPLAQGMSAHISALTIGNNSNLRTTDTLLDFIFVRKQAAVEPQVTVSRLN
ncbi:MAG TPA: DUF2341 domain-containing protein [Terriglobales bacterium]|nr:DUF2341 domain-containing protein [Terriglobales bacterium]